jgi:hypothetical protein
VESNLRDQKVVANNVTKFYTKVPRKDKDYLLSLNERRFDIINKSPSCSTSVNHIPQVSFDKQVNRTKELFGKSDFCTFYNSQKEVTMKRLNTGVPNI